MDKPKTKITRDQFEARLALRDHAPRLVAWTPTSTVLEWGTLADAVHNARMGDAYMHPEGARAWGAYLADHPKGERSWHGGVKDADDWDAVVRDPGDKLRSRVEACMAQLDALPSPFTPQPRRRNVRGLDEGDHLDVLRMQADLNWDRAWSERKRRNALRPSLRVLLNGGINCSLGQDAIAWRGAVALAIARRAEDAGATVEVLLANNWEGGASDNPERAVVSSWPIKSMGEFADRDLLTAYCCHLGSFRWFAWVLSAQNLQGDRVDYAWGRMGRMQEAARHLNADILIDYDCITKEAAARTLANAARVIEERQRACAT